MGKVDADLDRLLRAAAASAQPELTQAPFGFETRVVALWRAEHLPTALVCGPSRGCFVASSQARCW